MNRKFSLAIASTVAVTALISIAAPARAAIFNLGSLIEDDSSFVVGDKQFSEFFYNPGGSGIGPGASDITISTSGGGSPETPVELEIQGPFLARAQQVMDLAISFTLEVLNPSQRLDRIGLQFNGTATGDGFASFSLAQQTFEQVPAPGSELGLMVFGVLGVGYGIKRKFKKSQALNFEVKMPGKTTADVS